VNIHHRLRNVYCGIQRRRNDADCGHVNHYGYSKKKLPI
jgi:hypothetical protein